MPSITLRRFASFLLSLLLLSGLLATGTDPALAAAADQKVVIIVGPVGDLTDYYRSSATRVADEAEDRGAEVVTVFSPQATWANVRDAVDGANIIVYFGHGNGYPNPYGDTQLTDRTNGWGLNINTASGDLDVLGTSLVYCGEKALLGTLGAGDGAAQRQHCSSGPITPAPNFVMIYANACYAPGAGEGHDPKASRDVARQRVTNFSRPVLRLGAGAYVATDYGDSPALVGRILDNPTMTFRDIFAAGRGFDSDAVRRFAHPDVSGRDLYIQRTERGSAGLDYWYAFAGSPSKTPSGATRTPVTPNPINPPAVELVRHFGADRFATAAALSAANSMPGVDVVYVATGANFPDALAAGGVAARRGSPLLLVNSGSIPGPTVTELQRLQPGRIVVVGGPGVVGAAVLEQLRAYTAGGVTRLSGADRFATAAAISASTFDPGVPVAFVATGANFPDALSGVAATGVGGAPILLVKATEIPGATTTELRRLRPGRIVVLGGPGVISDGALGSLRGLTTGGVTRLSGADRYATSAAISAATFASADVVYLATGANFPDALGAGPLAARMPGPLLLTAPGGLSAAVEAELRRLRPSTVIIIGGTGVVPEKILTRVRAILE